MTRMVTIVNLVIILKKRLAKGTLFAPMQLPTMPQVAYCIPRVTIKSVAPIMVSTVIEASDVTPRIPDKTMRTSIAHHSAHIMTVEGKATLKYSYQPVNASLVIGVSATLISSEHEPQIQTLTIRKKSLVELA